MKKNYNPYIYQAKSDFEDRLFKMKNVVGVSVGTKITKGKDTGRECIRVYVEKKMPVFAVARQDLIPQNVEMVETDIIEVDRLDAPRPIPAQEYKKRMRPALGGISIGHFLITAGTFGFLVRDKESKEFMILSNNHVLANSNKAKEGDAILQPGPHDIKQQKKYICKDCKNEFT